MATKRAPRSETASPTASDAGPTPKDEKPAAAAPKVVTEPETDPELDPAREVEPETGVVSETGVTPGPEVAPQIRQPIERYQVGRPDPFRAGGHVLTERGWEIDPDAQLAAEKPTTDQPAADQRDTDKEH